LKLNDVNYRIGPCKGKEKLRIVHMNKMKRYIERCYEVDKISLVTDEESFALSQVTVAPGKAKGYYAKDITRIKEEYQVKMC